MTGMQCLSSQLTLPLCEDDLFASGIRLEQLSLVCPAWWHRLQWYSHTSSLM